MRGELETGLAGGLSILSISYTGKVEYFDIYSPVLSSVYSQVIWTTLPTVSPRADCEASHRRYADGDPWNLSGGTTVSLHGIGGNTCKVLAGWNNKPTEASVTTPWQLL